MQKPNPHLDVDLLVLVHGARELNGVEGEGAQASTVHLAVHLQINRMQHSSSGLLTAKGKSADQMVHIVMQALVVDARSIDNNVGHGVGCLNYPAHGQPPNNPTHLSAPDPTRVVVTLQTIGRGTTTQEFAYERLHTLVVFTNHNICRHKQLPKSTPVRSDARQQNTPPRTLALSW